jgi:hypothetical protein
MCPSRIDPIQLDWFGPIQTILGHLSRIASVIVPVWVPRMFVNPYYG